MKRVKHIHARDEHKGAHTCNCPSACKSYEYDLKISQSIWPASGELCAAKNMSLMALSKLVQSLALLRTVNSPFVSSSVSYPTSHDHVVHCSNCCKEKPILYPIFYRLWHLPKQMTNILERASS